MNCVKCGRETGEDQVFCELCLGEMENYPVKPGTAVHIPPRAPEEEVRKTQAKRKPVLSASEQVLRLKKKLFRTRLVLAVMLLVCGLLCFAVGWTVMELDFQRLLGQNYTIVQDLFDAAEPQTETAVP